MPVWWSFSHSSMLVYQDAFFSHFLLEGTVGDFILVTCNIHRYACRRPETNCMRLDSNTWMIRGGSLRGTEIESGESSHLQKPSLSKYAHKFWPFCCKEERFTRSTCVIDSFGCDQNAWSDKSVAARLRARARLIELRQLRLRTS